MSTQNRCKSCNGTLVRQGNFDVCEFCGNKWAIVTEDAMQVKLQNAWDALRQSDFDKAVELFEDIIIEDKKNFEAYWGKALAENGVVFVNDMREDKKVPTCNNITENSFIQNANVKKAIELAPEEVASNYSELAEKIENIRIEWLEKASKEPPYDVFICFKDSDKENGIERTPDSINAQEIYTALVEEGYRVFFSRVSLRDKVAEQYEPYIYNALKTAKVMIVYGEKPEYFNAVWLKNEWNRFRARIEKGEKHKNSLVVVCKNMDAGELPIALKARQCINANDTMWYPTLSKHVKKVIELSEQNVHLDRIKIEGGQMSKKATTLSVNSVKTREIGAGAAAETDISEKQTINLINTYLLAKDWKEAHTLIDDVLFDNPYCAEAFWCKIIANSRSLSENDFCGKIEKQQINFGDFDILEKLLNCATKDFATHVLDLLYDIKYPDDGLFASMLEHILPFSYANRDEKIKTAFDKAINRKHQRAFDLLLGTLGSDEVDRYISYNLAIVKTSKDNVLKRKYLNNILSVDEGNIVARRMLVEIDITTNLSVEFVKNDFENLLKYADNADREVEHVMDIILSDECVLGDNNIAFMKQLLRYYNGNIVNLKNRLIKFVNRILKAEYNNDVEYYCNLILSVDKNCAEAYWGLCLYKIGVSSEENVISALKPIKSCSEFNKYLTLVDENRRIKCIELAKKQQEHIEDLKKDKSTIIGKNNQEIAKLKSENEKLSKKKFNAKLLLVALQLAIFIGIAVVVGHIIYIESVDLPIHYQVNPFDEDLIIPLAWVMILMQCPSIIFLLSKDKKPGCGIYIGAVVANAMTVGFAGFVCGMIYLCSKRNSGWEEYRQSQKLIAAYSRKIDELNKYNEKCRAFINDPEAASNIADESTLNSNYATNIHEKKYKETIRKKAISIAVGIIIVFALVVGGAFGVMRDIINDALVESTEIEIDNLLDNDSQNEDEAIYQSRILAAYSSYMEISPSRRKDVKNAEKLLALVEEFELESVYEIQKHLEFEYYDRLYTVKVKPKSVDKIKGVVKIPAAYDGQQVTAIAEDGFKGCSEITTLIIPNTIQTVGDGAFSGCSNISVIYMPIIDGYLGEIFGSASYSGAEEINQDISNSESKDEDKTFYIPSSLEEVHITKSNNSSGGFFANCSMIKRVVFEENVTDIYSYQFYNCTGLENIDLSGIQYIGNNAFEGCSSLVEISISDSVKSISSNAFANCSSLKSVQLGESITSLAMGIFENCTALTSIEMNNLETISERAFENCTALSVIHLGDSVTQIGANAFKGCSSLARINSENDGEFVIPATINSIGAGAFNGCVKLQSLTIPFVGCSPNENGTSRLFGNIFGSDEYEGGVEAKQYYRNNNNDFKTFYIPQGLKTVTVTNTNALPSGAFNNCTMLTKINLHEELSSVGDRAFANCSGLTEMSLPSITSISELMFSGCTGLTSVTFNENITSIGKSAFEGCTSLLRLNSNVDGSFIISEKVTNIGASAFAKCTSLKEIHLPSVTTISESMFSGCTALTSVTFSDKVTSIGKEAFAGCASLSRLNSNVDGSFVISEKITSIGEGAFGGCVKMQSITIPHVGNTSKATGESGTFGYIFGSVEYDGTTATKQIYNSYNNSKTYYIPSQLKTVTITSAQQLSYGAFYNCSMLTKVNLNDKLTTIGEYAFSGCSGLTSLETGSSLTTIKDGAFRNCTSLSRLNSANEGEFVVGSNVTSIGYNAFGGCTKVQSITLPFVGNSKSATSEKALFGYIFGETKTDGSKAVQQYYKSSASKTYYIPETLKSVTITNASYIRYGAFYNCSDLTSIRINSGASIDSQAFTNCVTPIYQ